MFMVQALLRIITYDHNMFIVQDTDPFCDKAYTRNESQGIF